MNAGDIRKVKRHASRLGVRDSDVIRYAVKSTLARLGPLYDLEVHGRNLTVNEARPREERGGGGGGGGGRGPRGGGGGFGGPRGGGGGYGGGFGGGVSLGGHGGGHKGGLGGGHGWK